MTVIGSTATQAPDATGPGDAGSSFWGDLADQAMRVVWCWPALLMLVLGCYQVTRPEMWRDELASWAFASRPTSELVTIVRHTNASELAYYLLLHYWIAAFGDSVFTMRLLSVLAMTGAAACVTLIGRKLAGPKAGLLTGLVFALVPSVSRFAQETRFYALQVLLAMLATLLLLRALDRPTVRRWAAYGVCVAVLGAFDLVALCLLAGHAVVVLLRWWRDRERGHLGFVVAALAGCLACAPLALAGLGQAHNQLIWLPRPGLSLGEFSFFGRNLFYSTAVAAALIFVAVLAWAVNRRAAAVATAIAVAPVAALWVLSQGPTSYFFPRYMLFTVGAWAVLAGLALSRLDARVAAAAVLVFGILGAGDQQVIRGVGAHSWADYPVSQNTQYLDYAGAASFIAGHVRPADGIAYPGVPDRWEMIDYGVQYYLSRDLPSGAVPREVFVAKTAAAAGTIYPVICPDATACLGQTPRVWIVGSGYLSQPSEAFLPGGEYAVLRAHYRVERIRHFPSLTVFLLVRSSPLYPAYPAYPLIAGYKGLRTVHPRRG
jgi:mannosyltransferase